MRNTTSVIGFCLPVKTFASEMGAGNGNRSVDNVMLRMASGMYDMRTNLPDSILICQTACEP